MKRRVLTVLFLTVLLGIFTTAWSVTINVPADYPTIQAAIDAAGNYDTINIAAGTYAVTTAISVNKPLTIQGAGIGQTIVQTPATSTDPTTVFAVSASNVTLKLMTIQQRKTTNSSVESAVSVTFPYPWTNNLDAFTLDTCRLESMEFGITVRGQNWTITNCQLAYVGPLANNHRLIGVYGNAGTSTISNNTFECSAESSSTKRTVFIYCTSSDGSERYNGTLNVMENTQTSGDLNQFYSQDELRGDGFILNGVDNTFDAANANFVLYGLTPLDYFTSITLTGNTTPNAGGKGLLGLDGPGPLGPTGSTTLTMYDNVLTNAAVTRDGYLEATGSTGGLVGYKTAVFYDPNVTILGPSEPDGADIFVDAPLETIGAGVTQTYSIKIAHVENLQGFDISIKFPKADFATAPTNLAIGPLFQPNFNFVMDNSDANYWIYDVVCTKLGPPSVSTTGDDAVVLFSYDATSTADYTNLPAGCYVEVEPSATPLSDPDGMPIAVASATDKLIYIENAEEPGTIIYVDALLETIEDGVTQTYSVMISEVEDLYGFSVQVLVPKADFANQPTSLAYGPSFPAMFPFFNVTQTTDHWVITADWAAMGTGSVTGEDLVLFTFSATSTENYSNLPDGCYIEVPADVVELRDHLNADIPLDGTQNKLIYIDGGFVPVELSSFTAVFNSNTEAVCLTWITQSESNLSGYYIYRGLDNELQDAVRINTLITGTNTSTQQEYIYNDREITPSTAYWYWLMSVDIDGQLQMFGPISVQVPSDNPGTPGVPIALTTGLTNAFPNPFESALNVNYSLKKAGQVEIVVANVKGQIVRTLVSDNKSEGVHNYLWDSRDASGQACSSGIYFIRMTCENKTYSQKVILSK